MKELKIPHIDGEKQYNPDELLELQKRLGYPVLVRPSYVIGGQSMFTIYSEKELKRYIAQLDAEFS